MVNFLKSEHDRFPGTPDFPAHPISLSMRSRGQGAHGVKALTGVGSVRRSIAVADWVFSLGFAMLPPFSHLGRGC